MWKKLEEYIDIQPMASVKGIPEKPKSCLSSGL